MQPVHPIPSPPASLTVPVLGAPTLAEVLLMQRNVFVSNLPPNIDPQGLQELFKRYGHIVSCRVVSKGRGDHDGLEGEDHFHQGPRSAASPPSSHASSSRKYAFVLYIDASAAQRAIRALNGYEIEPEKRLLVRLAFPRPKTPQVASPVPTFPQGTSSPMPTPMMSLSTMSMPPHMAGGGSTYFDSAPPTPAPSPVMMQFNAPQGFATAYPAPAAQLMPPFMAPQHVGGAPGMMWMQSHPGGGQPPAVDTSGLEGAAASTFQPAGMDMHRGAAAYGRGPNTVAYASQIPSAGRQMVQQGGPLTFQASQTAPMPTTVAMLPSAAPQQWSMPQPMFYSAAPQQ